MNKWIQYNANPRIDVACPVWLCDKPIGRHTSLYLLYSDRLHILSSSTVNVTLCILDCCKCIILPMFLGKKKKNSTVYYHPVNVKATWFVVGLLALHTWKTGTTSVCEFNRMDFKAGFVPSHVIMVTTLWGKTWKVADYFIGLFSLFVIWSFSIIFNDFGGCGVMYTSIFFTGRSSSSAILSRKRRAASLGT